MLVRSATSRIGKTPASTAEPTPAIQVTRWGVPWRSTLANQGGSSPSRLIENQTRVTPSRKVSMTVRMESTAKTEMMLAMTGRPTLREGGGEPCFRVDLGVALHAREDEGRGDVERHRDDQRQYDGLGHVFLAVLGLLGGGAHGVVSEDGEEHGRRAGEHGAEAGRHERVVVGGVDVEDPQPDDEEDENDLDADGDEFEAAEGLCATAQDEGDEQADEDRGDVDDAAFLGARGDREREVDPEAVEERAEVAGDPDRDDGDDGDVLQEEVPADEPRDEFTERDVAVGVRRAGSRDHAGELGVGQSCGR